ncbi:MAG: LysE family translocator [Cyanobacteria bacterium J06638_7]
MSFLQLLGLFAALAALALVPSSSVALVVARSSSAGFLNGSAVVTGIVCGDLVFIALAVAGMSALADSMGGLFLILRYLAGGFLIWFGLSLIRSKAGFQLADAGRSASTLSSSFFSGLLLTLGDVKAIVFYGSLFPAFVDLASIGPSEITQIAITTIFAVGGVKLGYAYFARLVVASVANHRAERSLKLTAGCLMMGVGSYLIAKA